MNTLDSADSGIEILDEFSFNFYDASILAKTKYLKQQLNSKDAKSYHEFCIFYALRQLIMVPVRVTSRTSRITDHHLLARLIPERVPQSGVIGIALADDQCNR